MNQGVELPYINEKRREIIHINGFQDDMDSSSYSSSNENNNDFATYYDYDYRSPYTIDGMSETSTEEFFTFYDNNSSVTDSCYGGESDNFSVDLRFYEDTDSSYDDDRTGSYTTTSRSTPDSSIKSSSIGMKGSLNILHRVPRPVGGGILKTSRPNINNNDTSQNLDETKITQETLEKLRETELEDVLQYARDIIKPDPKAKLTYSTQPAKVVEGSFRHLLSVKELYSKTGAFKYRTISLQRNLDEDIGISVRKGDGWEKDEGIYISRVSLGSVFDQYEILRVGDEIVQVNKVDVKKMSADDVIRLMHIPEKLSVTVKMLTPFSKKRVEQSNINALKFKNLTNGLQNRKFIPSSVSKSSESLYKVAHLQIGNEKRNIYTHQLKTKNRLSNINNNNNNGNRDTKNNINKDQQQKTVKISPYRSMEGGKAVPSKQCLSPIREFSMSNDSPPPLRRKQSYVRWFDES